MSSADQIPQTIEEEHDAGLHVSGENLYCMRCIAIRRETEAANLRARVAELEVECTRRAQEAAALREGVRLANEQLLDAMEQSGKVRAQLAQANAHIRTLMRERGHV